MSSDRDDKHLPAILCLHGGGTSALIFQLQTIQLRHALRNDFRFVFANAPVESEPGPGVMPFFETCGPYYMWIVTDPVTNKPRGLDESIATLEALEHEQGPFVGILGFSQGTMVGLGLLLRDQLRARSAGYKFAVLVGGSRPPLPLTDGLQDRLLSGDERWESWTDWAHYVDGIVHVPTIHVHGSGDVYVQENKFRQLGFCDRDKATVLDYEGEHHMPRKKEDTLKLAELIRQTYQKESQKG